MNITLFGGSVSRENIATFMYQAIIEQSLIHQMTIVYNIRRYI